MKTQKEFHSSGIKTNSCILKKSAILFSAFLFQAGAVFSQQQTYDNFEGNKSLHYSVQTGGQLDTLANNPKPDKINNSKKCAKYIRSEKKKYDNIKMILHGKLTDVSTYATYTGVPPEISMKVYTDAPLGTLIELQLGTVANTEYPAGINSQYQAYTTVKNAWEEVKFKYSQTPVKSETSTTQIDQITLLFNPDSSTKDTYYFDDITGPSLVAAKKDISNVPAVK